MTEQVKAIIPAQEYVDVLKQVLEINQMLVKQNSLIVQSITLPQLIIKGDRL